MSHYDTYNELAQFGKTLLDNPSLDKGLGTISESLKKLTGAMRCSIFVYDHTSYELWTMLANGVDKIVVPANKGLVGHVFTTKQDIIENNVAHSPHFLQEIDTKSGYNTINMLVCPIYDSNNKVIGVLQLLNKLDGFSDKDMQFIQVILRFISSFIEIGLVHYKR